MGILPKDSSRAGRRRRHAFCARRGKHRAGASVALPLTQGSAPYRSLHPGLLCAAPFGAWLIFESWDAGLIGQRRGNGAANQCSLRLTRLCALAIRATIFFSFYSSWFQKRIHRNRAPLSLGSFDVSILMDLGERISPYSSGDSWGK